MPALDNVINIQISQQTSAVAQASFGIPLIVGPTSPGWTSTDYVHAYSSAAAMLTDGYNTASPEYQYALAMMAQTITPTQFLVGKRSGATTAQVDVVQCRSSTPLTAGTVINMTVNGKRATYTVVSGDTTNEIMLGHLASAISALNAGVSVGSVTGTGGSAQFTITSLNPGTANSYGTDAMNNSYINLLLGGSGASGTVANAGIVQDLANIQKQNDTWYGFCVAGAQAYGSPNEVLQAAGWTEGQKKIYLASTNIANNTSAGDVGDVASALQAAAYRRTALLYTVAGYAQGAEAAWLGGQLPQTPGSNNWAFKTLNGITADKISDTARANFVGNPVAGVVGKNGNIYTSLGGVNVTQFGTMASGQYIDITIGIDWLQATMQTNIWAVMAKLPKIPYTDTGTAVLIQAVRQAIDQGVTNKLIAPDGITITAPPVLSVSQNQRAQRIAPTISFGCRLQGAFNAVTIQGTVTV